MMSALALLLCCAGGVRAATTTCTAAGIMAVEPGCPIDAAQPCRILSAIAAPAGEACDLDFSGRDLVIGSPDGPGGSLRSDTLISLRAKSLTIHANGSINGRGDDRNGADLLAVIDGPVTLMRKGVQMATIDVSNGGDGVSYADPNSFSIRAAGAVTIDGLIRSGKQLHAPDDTPGTYFDIDSESDIVGQGQIIDAEDEVALFASGRIDFGGKIDVDGTYGGSVVASATGDVRLHDIEGVSTDIATYGGDVCIDSDEGDVSITGEVDLRATGGAYESDGGVGGIFEADANQGSISISGRILLGNTSTFGEGGGFYLDAAVDVVVEAGAAWSVAAGNSEGQGGSGEFRAGRDVLLRGELDLSGRSSGGSFGARAGRDVIVDGRIDAGAPAGDDYASGGWLRLEAGSDKATGHLVVHGQIDTNGGGCLYGSTSGSGGEVELEGCDVTIAAAARVRACGGGSIVATARRQLSVAGELRTFLPGKEGEIRLVHHQTIAPELTMGSIDPPPVLETGASCSPGTSTPYFCLAPCPECGDGVVEYPETCDTPGTPVSCDGCSATCRTEEPGCDDDRSCTVDSCHPVLACLHDPVYPCYSCLGDVDRNGVVDAVDFIAVTDAINRCGGTIVGCSAAPNISLYFADFDYNVKLTAADLSRMSANRLDPSLPDGCLH